MDSDQKQAKAQEMRYHVVGWVLFLLCAVFFLASSIQNGDTMALIGSVLFLVACFAFLIPLVRNLCQDHDDIESS